MTDPLPAVVLYARSGCHLCEEARAALELLLGDRAARGLPAPAIDERDIEADEALHRAFAFTIPVVEIGEHRLELATSMAKLRRLLADALDAPEPVR
jgi:glutaredoxin